MKRNLANSLLLIVSVVLLFACSDRRGAGVLSMAKLEAVLYDYHLAQVMVNDLPSNQRYKKDLYFDYIYNKHGVTKAEIDSSLVFYARYPKDLSEVYVKLSKRVESEIQHMEQETNPVKVREAVSVVGDSADLWYDARIVQMASSYLANHRYTFIVPTDTNFRAGDCLVWSGKAMFLQGGVDSLFRYLYLNLGVKYMNDSIVSADTLLYTSGEFSIVVSDTFVVKSISGTAYLKGRDTDERLLLVSPKLMRYRRNELSDSLNVDSLVKE